MAPLNTDTNSVNQYHQFLAEKNNEVHATGPPDTDPLDTGNIADASQASFISSYLRRIVK
jgi:hypothetical protein